MAEIFKIVWDMLKSIFIYRSAKKSVEAKGITARNKVLNKYIELDNEIATIKQKSEQEIIDAVYTRDGWDAK